MGSASWEERLVASFENTVMITRPIEDVFAFLSDFENVPKWNYAIVETRKVSEGVVGVGTIYQQVRSVPSRSEESFEVTAYNPPRHRRCEANSGRSRPASPMPWMPFQREPASRTRWSWNSAAPAAC
jgi:Polyketide cyclase / dehydrase and lipid transport